MKDFFDSWVEAHEKDILRDIGRLVAIRSVKGETAPHAPFGAAPAAALEEALKICGELGLAAENLDGFVGTADAADAPRALDILCHLDVVGEGTGWHTDPYQAVVKDGCIWGRGVDDDKGPAVCAMYAMKAVMECSVPLKKNVRLILGTDEESGSADITHYYRTLGEKPAPATFSPDNAFPVYNVEKGLYRETFSKTFAPCSVLPRVTALEGGFRHNVVPPDAWATVEGMTDEALMALCRPEAEKLGVTVTVQNGRVAVCGLSAHASTPWEGKNAMTALVQILLALPLADAPSTAALRELDRLMPHGDHFGKALGIAMDDPVSGPLTLAFTILRLDEGGITGTFDSRTALCATRENCLDIVRGKLEPLGYRMKGDMIPPHCTPEDSDFVQTLLRDYELVTGQPGKCIPSGGATYVHDVPGGVAFGVAMPGVNTNLHGADEHIPVENLLSAVKIFALVIYDMCCR